MKAIGLILILLGAIGLGYGFISFTHEEKVIDAGPLQVSADKKERWEISPWISGGMILAGAIVLLLPRRK